MPYKNDISSVHFNYINAQRSKSDNHVTPITINFFFTSFTNAETHTVASSDGNSLFGFLLTHFNNQIYIGIA